ncbi:MAG: thioredoxin family protein [Acidobacteriota bacterium]|nr:thioredoxin family protein [Acidobacteriota bacterium]
MKKATALVLLTFGLTASAADSGWITDMDEAQKVAQEDNKYILVNFTGSDWCGWCKRLDREVFSKKEFADFADNNLVLLKLDFPKFKKLPEGQRESNEALARKYRVRGFPTILLLDKYGERVMETGYRPGGPGAYVTYLKKRMSGV